jgi:integrase
MTIERAQLKGGVGARRKTIRSRRVPLTERVRGAIADYLGSLAAMPQGPVFKSRIGDNRPITRGQAHRQLKCLARELGLDAARLGCHSARKTFALQVHRAAHFDLVKTQRVMGHSSPVTTARYLETNQDELDSLVLSLGTAPAPAVRFAATLGA